MNILPRRAALQSLAGGLLAAAAVTVHSQRYPNRPLHFIVGFPPGGSTDLVARVLGKAFYERTGQPVIVDNRPGANMIIGSTAIAQAPRDGYTLGLAGIPTVTNPSLYAKLPFDTNKDFTWITQVTNSLVILVVNNASPVKSVQELIAGARSRPRQLTYGSSGSGGALHLASVLMQRMANIEFTHIPYKGTAPAIQDLLAGRFDFMFADTGAIMPLIRSGQVRPIGVTSKAPYPALPAVPPIDKILPGYEMSVWFGLCGPAGLDPAIVAFLAEQFRSIVQAPATVERLATMGYQPVGSSPNDFESFVKSELARWSDVIKAANIRLD